MLRAGRGPLEGVVVCRVVTKLPDPVYWRRRRSREHKVIEFSVPRLNSGVREEEDENGGREPVDSIQGSLKQTEGGVQASHTGTRRRLHVTHGKETR